MNHTLRRKAVFHQSPANSTLVSKDEQRPQPCQKIEDRVHIQRDEETPISSKYFLTIRCQVSFWGPVQLQRQTVESKSHHDGQEHVATGLVDEVVHEKDIYWEEAGEEVSDD